MAMRVLAFSHPTPDHDHEAVVYKGAIDEEREERPRAWTPIRKRTQEDQDRQDDKAHRKAMKELVQSWMDRLQLISLITTFFASIEAGLLQITTPDSVQDVPRLQQAANAGLLGALVVHINAAIISFLAAFLLVRYKFKEAGKVELQAQGIDVVKTPVATSPDLERADGGDTPGTESNSKDDTTSPDPIRVNTSPEPPIFSSNPQLVQVGPFRRPDHLLGRCHSLCILLAFIGFVLALVGIVCFAWARHPTSVSVFATTCMGVCLFAGASVFI